jgi:hypothetical protein
MFHAYPHLGYNRFDVEQTSELFTNCMTGVLNIYKLP